MSVALRTADFDPGDLTDTLSRRDPAVTGAVASFVGLVRGGDGPDPLVAMTLEHYPGMTEAKLAEIEAAARARWPLIEVIIVHRVGRLRPGDRIVYVGVAARHRQAAFEACEFLMDYLKTQAPFWKQEETASGSRWVAAKAADDLRAERWTET